MGGAVRDHFINPKLSPLDYDVVIDVPCFKKIASLLQCYSPILIEAKVPHYKIIQDDFVLEISPMVSNLKSSNVEMMEINGNHYFINHTKHLKLDSDRRDFSINAIYLNLETGDVFDFHRGIQCIKERSLQFNSSIELSFLYDPCRMIRGIRFMLKYGFKFEEEDSNAIKSLFSKCEKIFTGKQFDKEVGKAVEASNNRDQVMKLLESYNFRYAPANTSLLRF